MRTIIKSCINVLKLSPGWVILNALFIVLFSVCQLGTSYFLARLCENLLSSHLFRAACWDFVLLIVCICIGGNTFNFNNLLSTIYLAKYKKRIALRFFDTMSNTSEERFYEPDFYDNLKHLSDHLDDIAGVAVSVFTNLFGIIVVILLSVGSLLYIRCRQSSP